MPSMIYTSISSVPVQSSVSSPWRLSGRPEIEHNDRLSRLRSRDVALPVNCKAEPSIERHSFIARGRPKERRAGRTELSKCLTQNCATNAHPLYRRIDCHKTQP